MRTTLIFAGLGGALLIALVASAPQSHAQQLQTPASCQVGMRVHTRDGHSGTITRVDRAWSYCYVRQDDGGKEVGYLYSLLEAAGGSGGGGAAGRAGAAAGTLPPGVYECIGNGTYTFLDMRITGPGTYAMSGHAGRYQLLGSGKIVFLSGPLQPYHSRLLSGGRIGLNANGDDSFYATSCELNRSKR